MIILRIRKAYLRWGGGIFIGGLFLLAIVSRGSHSPLFRGQPHGRDVHVCTPGAWGRVWFEPSTIEIPPDRIQIQSVGVKATEWYVAGHSPSDLEAALQACGLSPEQAGELLATLTPAGEGAGNILHPSAAFVISLDPLVRRKLYGMLAGDARNEMCVWPFRFSGDPSEEWIKEGSLDKDVADLVKSLIYREGNSLMFSDMDLVLARYPSMSVYSNLFSILSRQSTLVARVRVQPEDDVDILARYWGYPNREDDVRTFLKTMQGTDDCRDVPVSMLLPGFARNRIYRYWHEGDPAFASCHYTAMNFLNQRADGRFTNLTEVARTLASDYMEIKADFRLGDIVLLMKNESEAIHSCNYVADGIVFTRNGGSVAQPWMLMTLDAAVDFYSYPDPVHIKVMRRKN